ncbi:bacterial bifunctional deaminase-reductase [Byssothecium circinans]|uniref:2,5-diamino-6-ribosylamino-4(3H)-pyrimidinone 5'-phosphate reductase n=1 Tax=Byssothecium circinans TaxID=147558 RepID=A0A6A5U2A7_9PLEO|nr:bacterial bifunctional deaminase-reductase [Byssothecium circinans]
MAKPRETLTFPPSSSALIAPYLPPTPPPPSPLTKPFVTLTYATSLDASLSLAPGIQTALSGSESKAMTHYLRSRHSAILVGCGTAIADDPSLNCRIEGVGGYGGQGLQGQPRPVVLDPRGRWALSEESKVVRLAREGRGRAPWVFTVGDVEGGRRAVLEGVGGRFIKIESEEGRMDWGDALRVLGEEGVESVMVEGGGDVINTLLSPEHFGLVDSVIVTMAPTWLGKGGVAVIPEERRDGQGHKIAVGRLRDVKWVPLGDDVVLCGRP